jgi:formylglycine-generating enzyme required for sulfatase activity
MWRLIFFIGFSCCVQAFGSPEVEIASGVYSPFFREAGEKDQKIDGLRVDRHAVTNQDFLTFVRSHPEWRRSKVPRVFADAGYLEHWSGDQSLPKSIRSRPVTNVSWFAARKYCEKLGKRLLRTAEWEYVSDAQNPENLKIILEWYGRPETAHPRPANVNVNTFGLTGMHGDVWEWVDDFSSAIVVGDSRSQGDMKASMFCGAGALKAKDPTQYATFMRFAHRSSLRANSVGRSLGFRCARSIPTNKGSNP